MTTLLSLLTLLNASTTTYIFIVLLVILVVIIIVVSAANKNSKKLSNSSNSGSKKSKGKTGNEAPFYRWCRDNQKFISRTPEQQKLVDKYFIVRNVKQHKKPLLIAGIILAVLGVILLIIGSAISTESVAPKIVLIIIGILFIIVGIALVVTYKNKIRWVPPEDLITHEQYEQMVATKIKSLNVEQRGLDNLGLDIDQVREIRPLVFLGRELDDKSLKAYDSENKKIHSSTRTVTLVYFTDEQVFLYKLTFDMTCDNIEEHTSEFFYVDICDILISVEDGVSDDDGGKVEYSTLYVRVIANNSEMRIAMENDNVRMASIKAMRQKIRERKMR